MNKHLTETYLHQQQNKCMPFDKKKTRFLTLTCIAKNDEKT